MPTDSVWIIITIPRKEYEMELKKLKFQNNRNNNNNNYTNQGDIITSMRQQKDIGSDSWEKVVHDTLDELQFEAVWVPTRNGNHYQVYFSCDLMENDAVLNIFKEKGIGCKAETSIGFIPFNLFFKEEFSDDSDDDSNPYPGEKGGKKYKPGKNSVNIFKKNTQEFLQSVTSRLTVAQVVDSVRSGSEITFDYCAYSISAAFICCFGLVADDPINISASMCIEPIIGTVMAMTFGLLIEDKSLFWLGFRNNIISIFALSMLPGYIIGLIFFIWRTEWNPPPNGIWPTSQMQGRGTYWGLIYGVMIASPVGGAVAVSLLHSNYVGLVGVAIASTFQPPFINTGMEWALATHIQIRGLWQQTVPYNMSGHIYYMKPAWAPQNGYTPVYSYDMRIENTLLGCVSMALTTVNVFGVLVVAYFTLRIKEIIPLKKISPLTQRFFNKDIRLAREYNRKHPRQSFGEPLGKQILSEWAEIAGIDKKQFLNSSPEARITQLQTLYDIIKDVEKDETYKRVIQMAMNDSRRTQNADPGLMRRLTRPYIPRADLPGNYSDPMQNPAVWNIEQELAKALDNGGRRKYSGLHNPAYDPNGDDEDYYNTFGMGRGLRPENLVGERRQSKLLRKSLRYSTRSPYSVWPGARSQTRDSFDNYSEVRHRQPRRTSYPARFDSNTASTTF